MKIEIILSIIAIVVSVITSAFNIVFETKNRKFRQKTFDYDVQKETTRQLEKRTDDIYTRLNSRSSLIPCFNPSLNQSKIFVDGFGSGERIRLRIFLINIGKESAVDIKLVPYNSEEKDYIKSRLFNENSYIMCEYLSDNYAFQRGEVNFELILNQQLVNQEETDGCISFKITFKDLLGNTYLQEFSLSYKYHNYSFVFYEINSSIVPRVIEENVTI